MDQSIINDKYILHWKCETGDSFIAEIFHWHKNSHGGAIQTPIGILLGLSNKQPYFWNIRIILRNDISYDSNTNSINIITKSAYKNKIRYYIDKLKTNKQKLISFELKKEILDYLLLNKLCEEPLSITVGMEKQYLYEFHGNLSLDDFD